LAREVLALLLLLLRGTEAWRREMWCRLLVLLALGLEVLQLLPALQVHLPDTRPEAGRVEDPGAVLEPESVESRVLAFFSLIGWASLNYCSSSSWCLRSYMALTYKSCFLSWAMLMLSRLNAVVRCWFTTLRVVVDGT